MGCFDLVLAQTDTDVERYASLGAKQVERIGNLKFAVPPLPCDEGTLVEIRTRTGLRPMWLAASKHDGEEKMAWDVHCSVKKLHRDLLTIIVPRHQSAAKTSPPCCEKTGLPLLSGRTANLSPLKQTSIWPIQSVNSDCSLDYRQLCSWENHWSRLAGKTPSNRHGTGELLFWSGHTWNFAEVTKSMREAGGIEIIANTSELAHAVATDLGNPSRAQSRAQAALKYAEAESAVLERFIDRITPFLDPAEGNTHART